MHTRLFHYLRRNLLVALGLLTTLSVIVTFIIITTTTTLGLQPVYIRWLSGVNITLLVLLVSVISFRIFNMWRALKAQSIGSSLQKKVILLFAIVAILPTIIVSVFSAMFFNLGIQNWFDERVQTAVDKSLAVAEAYLGEHKENIRADALAMASDMSRAVSVAITDPREFNRILAVQSRLRAITESVVIHRNRVIAQGPLSFALAFQTVPPEILQRADAGEVVISTADDDKVRALVKIEGMPEGYLLVGRLIDSRVVEHMRGTQGAVHEYNLLEKQLNRLQLTFSAVFATMAVLLLLAAIGYGIAFASRITRPIFHLASAAERVRGGDYSARVDETAGDDEIGQLTRTFNRMTEQLEAQRGELIDANRRLDERRRFTEAVLSGVSAGIIATDHTKRITLVNRSAAAILQTIEQPLSSEIAINEALPGVNELLVQAEQQPGEIVDNMLTISRNGKTISLHLRITVEKHEGAIEGFIITFDDITQLVAAQRTAAWADVARRVAHEIKNPLTPIQLSAERLKRKYLKFITEDQENFVKYTDTISRHVADIGRMVEEFVSFARMPTPSFAQEDMIAIVKKAVFSAQVPNPSIEFTLAAPDYTLNLMCDERQMTQIFSNLLKNACESIEAKAVEAPAAYKGHIHVEMAQIEDQLIITLDDNGTGFPEDDAKKFLDPYVTTRSKGTGLGLSIVKKIVEDHKGMIRLENRPGGGARILLSFLQQCDINATNQRASGPL